MVDFTQIRDILKVGNFYYDLFKEENINPWSWNKPMDYDKIQRLTEDDKKSINYGWDVKIYNSISELITDVENENMWKYLVPTNMLRISDFESYNPKATKPFQLYFKNGINYGNSGETIMFAIDDDILQIFKWGALKEYPYDNWNVGFLIGKNLTSKNLYYYKVSNIQDTDGEKFPLVIPAEFKGDYKCVLVLTTFSQSSGYINVEELAFDNWLSFPCSPLMINVNETPQFNPWSYFDINASGTFEESNLVVSSIDFTSTINMNVEFNGSVDISVEYIVKNTLYGNTIRNITIAQDSFKLVGGSEITESYSYNEPFEMVELDTKFKITAVVYMTSGTWSENREFIFELDRR